MKHSGTQTIETKRLILRRFQLSDCEAVFNNWAHDKDVTHFLTWPAHKDLSVTKMIVSDWVEQYKNSDFYQWAIVLKDSNEPIGSISVVNTDERCEAVEIGYCIGKKWWHQGITTEAFKGIIPYLFETVEANRIVGCHDPINKHSGQVMLKCGLQYEGTMRQASINNQGIVDLAVYAILRSDYEKRQLETLSQDELWTLFPIFLVPHKKEWKENYKEMEAFLKAILQDYSDMTINHIGSTSISDIWAKDIVDVLIEIPSYYEINEVAKILEHYGFYRMYEEEKRISFNKGYTLQGFDQKVYHLHLRYEGDHDELYFRDYLNSHHDVAKEYETLKLKLWKKYEHNRDAYTNAKTAFIKKYTHIAKQEN